jgi:metal-sulfur cluster biosynthetic enzyme
MGASPRQLEGTVADPDAMASIERQVRRALDEIKDPCSISTSVPMGLCEMGIVKSVSITPEGEVDVELRLTSPVCEMVGYMRTETIARVGALPGVSKVSVRNDSGLDWTPDLIAPEARERRERRLHTLRRVHQLGSSAR